MTVTPPELAAQLREYPQCWDDFTPEMQECFLAAFPAGFVFDQQQRTVLATWWLECQPGDVQTMNLALAPTHAQVLSFLAQKIEYLSADLMTDCLNEGQTYYAALPQLRTTLFTEFPDGLPVQTPKARA
jgi:hypothetical protein